MSSSPRATSSVRAPLRSCRSITMRSPRASRSTTPPIVGSRSPNAERAKRTIDCIDIPAPSSLNINIVPPVADPQKTTRERFAIHSQDPACAACHTKIDAIGFTFEGLDGMGKARTTENGKPIDSSTTLAGGLSFDGSYPDAAALAMQIATSSELQQCFARKLFHSAAARDTSSEKTEAAFMAQVGALPAASQGKFADVLRAFVSSDLFIQRSME